MEIDILATLEENFEKCPTPPPPLTNSWIRAWYTRQVVARVCRFLRFCIKP